MTSILLAGFGGQGILFAGKLLASCGMYSGKNVTWLPSYGPEMRGGTANCVVVVSEDDIGSPLVPNPDVLIALNLPSFTRFEGCVAKGGIIVADSSLISVRSERQDIKTYYVPFTSMAQEHDMNGLANVISLGKLMSVSGIFTMEQIEQAMEKSIPAKKQALIELNKKALTLGWNS